MWGKFHIPANGQSQGGDFGSKINFSLKMSFLYKRPVKRGEKDVR